MNTSAWLGRSVAKLIPGQKKQPKCDHPSADRSLAAIKKELIAASSEALAARSTRERLAATLRELTGATPAVVIIDSFGRAWRRGTSGVAIGAAGLPSLLDLRGNPDLFGRILQVSITGFADEIAAAASLVMGQGNEAQPVVLIRGLRWSAPANPASHLVRPASEDMFR